MRRSGLPLFALLLAGLAPVASYAPPPERPSSAEVTIPRSELWVMHARDDGREYRIFVARPAGPPPPSGFPVLYVLDGNAVFATVAEAVRIQGRRTGATGVVPAIVVGVGYL